MWKGFAFPMSIESFKIKEDARVATYTYAGRNGAEHERVMNYRIFTLTWIFTSSSGDQTPAWYVNKLRALNDNAPGVLWHPVFWTYKCILKSLDISEDGSDLEGTYSFDASNIIPTSSGTSALQLQKAMSAGGKIALMNKAIANYKFALEFWESTPPNAASLQSKLSQLYPASSVKPLNDNYQTSNKYKSVTELYWALVNGQIQPGVDPIRNSEWLWYDYNFRKTAYDLWIADPKWTKQSKVDNTNKITTPKAQNIYTVAVGDNAMKVAKKLWVTPDALFQANSGKKVRNTTRGTEWLYWKKMSIMYPGDTLIIP